MPGCAYWQRRGPRSPRRRRVFWSMRRWRWLSMWVGWCTTRTPPIRRRVCENSWKLRFLGLADSVSAQVSEVSHQTDGAQAAGLPAGESQSQHGLDAAVGVNVLASVTRECRLRDRLEQPGLVKWARPAPARARPEKRATRLLLRDMKLLRRLRSRSAGNSTLLR